jgi:hypothetical protein
MDADDRALGDSRSAAIGQPVSVCHQWSITGTPSNSPAHR